MYVCASSLLLRLCGLLSPLLLSYTRPDAAFLLILCQQANLPYWTHGVAGWAVFGIGAVYWVIWVHILPRIGKYRLEQVEEKGKGGLSRKVFRKIPLGYESL